MPSPAARRVTAAGTLEPPKPGNGHEREVLLGEVRMVEEAREEVGRPAGHAEALIEHQFQDDTGIPDVDQVDGPHPQEGQEERVHHPDEVPNRRAGDLGRPDLGEHPVELAALEPDGAVGVDHALGVAGGARREADDRRRVGIYRRDTGDRVSVEERLERDGPRRQIGRRCRAHDEPLGAGSAVQHLAVDLEMVGVAEPIGCHHHRRLGGAEDVIDLFGRVEVDDRHDDGTEIGRGPERDAGLDPVGELEDHDVAGPDAARPQGAGERAGRPVDVAERPRPRADLGVHPERNVGHRPEALLHHRAERVVGPPALGEIALAQLARYLTKRPPGRPTAFCCHHRPLAGSSPTSGE